MGIFSSIFRNSRRREPCVPLLLCRLIVHVNQLRETSRVFFFLKSFSTSTAMYSCWRDIEFEWLSSSNVRSIHRTSVHEADRRKQKMLFKSRIDVLRHARSSLKFNRCAWNTRVSPVSRLDRALTPSIRNRRAWPVDSIRCWFDSMLIRFHADSIRCWFKGGKMLKRSKRSRRSRWSRRSRRWSKWAIESLQVVAATDKRTGIPLINTSILHYVKYETND